MFRNFAQTINDFANNSKGIQAVETPKKDKQTALIVIGAVILVSIIIISKFINK